MCGVGGQEVRCGVGGQEGWVCGMGGQEGWVWVGGQWQNEGV